MSEKFLNQEEINNLHEGALELDKRAKEKIEKGEIKSYQEAVDKEVKRESEFKLEEIENLIKKVHGEIRKNNDKAVLVFFTTAGKVERFDEAMHEIEKIPSLLIAEYCAKPADFEPESLERKADPTIESVIDYVLYRYKTLLEQYKEWRNKIESSGITAVDYIEMSLKPGVEGGTQDSTGNNVYISPRFVRISNTRGKPFFNMVGGGSTIGSRGNLYGLPNKLCQEIMNNHYEWLTITNLSKFNDYFQNDEMISSNKNQKEVVFNKALSNLQEKGPQYFKGLVESETSYSDDDEIRNKIVADFKNYLGFLDRSYEALERFITSIEQYK